MKRFLLLSIVALVVSLLCQCSTCAIEIERPTPPRLGDAAPRPGQRISIFGYPEVSAPRNRIQKRLEDWGTLEVGSMTTQDYVVHLDKPTEVGKLTKVTIWQGSFPYMQVIPNSLNLGSCMRCIASKTMLAGPLGEKAISDWVVEQLIPTMRTYTYRVDYADKPDLEIAARCVRNGAYQDALQALKSHVAQHPDDPEALYLGGITMVRLNEYDMARKAFNKAYSLKPDEKYRKAAADCSTIVSDAARVQPFVR